MRITYLVFLTIAVLVYTTACVTTQFFRPNHNHPPQIRQNSDIYGIAKSNGDFIEFSKDSPGRLVNGQIVGNALTHAGIWEKVSIPYSDVTWLWMNRLDLKLTITLAIPFLPIPALIVPL